LLIGEQPVPKFTSIGVSSLTRAGDAPRYAAVADDYKEAVMTTPELATFAVIAIAIMFGLLVRARRRVRAESRLALLERTVDPARGGSSSLDEAESGRDHVT
jgi:hypothetical protein